MELLQSGAFGGNGFDLPVVLSGKPTHGFDKFERFRGARSIERVVGRERIFLQFGAIQEDGIPFGHDRIIVP
jgi:hypothetical protein